MNFKKMMLVTIIAGLVTVPFVLAAPIKAYIAGESNNDMLKTQEQDRTRLRDCECNCPQDGTGDQIRTRTRLHECLSNGTENCTMNMEQYGYQHQNKKPQP